MNSSENPINWRNLLKEEFKKSYFQELQTFLSEERRNKKVIYPPRSEIFRALELCPFQKIKVVIIGQDPYHGPGQANGLCFSVHKNKTIPPSLQNIYKEIHNDLNISIPSHGDISSWAEQGVLLLNATLTVQAHSPASHSRKGWEHFTDHIIEEISQKKEHIVFLLWGRHAQNKEHLIDDKKHFILKAPHPSPFSANSGFFGCKHFSKTNHLLTLTEQEPINWSIK